MKLDSEGRCCGRKPLVYLTGRFTGSEGPQRFCPRCDRAFNLVTGEQIENWAWKKNAQGEFQQVSVL